MKGMPHSRCTPWDPFASLVRVGPANEQDWERVGELARALCRRRSADGWSWLYVEQGYSAERPTSEAEAHVNMSLEVVKHPESKRGFVLLPRRWVVGAISHGHRVSSVW